MEEPEFKQAYQGVNPLPCVFEKAVLLRCCTCGLCRRVYIAEREGVACTGQAAHARCEKFLYALYHKAQFALRLTEPQAHLPHAKMLKLQCGGLQGLQHALEETGATPEAASLLERADAEFNALEDLPYTAIIGFVTRFQGRRGKGK